MRRDTGEEVFSSATIRLCYIVGATTSLIAGELGLPTFQVVLRVVGNNLTVEVTGPANKTVGWVARVRTVEVAW